MDFGDEGYILVMLMPNLNKALLGIALSGTLTAFLLKKLRLGGSTLPKLLCTLSVGLALGILLIYRNFKILNSIIMKDYDVVEQPIRFNNLTQRLVKESVNFMEEQRKKGSPFLLYIPWVQVHTYLHTAPEFAGKSKHGRYGDNVEEMDWAVGQIVGAIDRLGLKKNTLVYFTSDHGGHKGWTNLEGEHDGGWNGIYPGVFCTFPVFKLDIFWFSVFSVVNI